MFIIEDELKKLPEKPGVYIMHDASDAIIYVGKAINLKRRVSQYFQKRVRSPKIERMISLIDHFEYLVVGSEMEALVLECNLIKENHPKYNTMLMDDKTYPFIKVTVDEPFPRVFLSRDRKKDKARYFGPYTNVSAAKDILKLLKSIYRVRPCNKKIEEGSCDKPCLYYHMQECDAPCTGKLSKDEYRASIDAIVSFLSGDSKAIKKHLEDEMYKASERMEFEKAAVFRDLLGDITKISEVQRVTGEDEADKDVLGIATAFDEAVVQVFFIRKGKMVGRDHFYMRGVENTSRGEIMGEFVKQFYAGSTTLPARIYLSEEIPEGELIEKFLSEGSGHKVSFVYPKRGEKTGLVRLACTNASTVLQKDAERLTEEQKKTTGALEELGRLLDIPTPKRLESYDISNISGFESVGSMVVYENGKPKKSDYRKFRIRTVQGPDDYASMKEVLTRRFSHGLAEKEGGSSSGGSGFDVFPDLILMDGGRGQVNIALAVLEELKLNVNVCGMVKDDKHRTRGIYYNNILQPVDQRSELFRLVTRIQDETHRFAIEYHRSLRSKEQVHSILDDIKGIGPARRLALMRAFESLDAISSASLEELENAEGMNKASAQSVYDFFHTKRE